MPVLKFVRPYVPEVGFVGEGGKPVSNRDASEEDQFYVKLKAVTQTVKNDRIKNFIETPPEKFMKMLMNPAQQKEMRDLLSEHVVGFVNLTVEVEEGVSRELTSNDLFDLGEFPLIMELFQELTGNSQLRSPDKEKKAEESAEEKDSEGN